MINLLPPAFKKQIKNRRLNTTLRRWLIITWAASLGLIVVFAVGWLDINQQTKDLNKSIADTNTELNAENLTKVQKDAKTLTGNIKTINQVLSREIRFSDLIQDIGKVMPPGTVLNTLTLGQVSGAINLSANAKNAASAAQIAVNLSDPKNQIFNKVDIINITCTNSTSAYPCTGQYRALFSKTIQSHYLGVAKDSQ